MTELLWILTWLPLVLTAASELPAPSNVMVTLNESGYFLTWKAGAGTPAGTVFSVNLIRGHKKVRDCQFIQRLICNLTEEFKPLVDTFDIEVEALLGNRTSQPARLRGYMPIVHLPLPKLNVTFCSLNICVDILPPYPRFQNSYNETKYQLRIKHSGADEAKFLDIRSLKSHTVTDLVPGRDYCISIRFAYSMLKFESNFSQPECISVPGHFSSDAVISAVLCLLVMALICVFALLFWTGFICLRRRPMPSVLTSIHHLEEVRVSSWRDPLSLLLNVRSMAPPVGKNNSCNSEESDEESCTEPSGRNSSGTKYALRLGANPLSSTSSSSSSLSSASKPEPPPSCCSNQTPDGSALQTEVLVVIETQPGAEQNPQRPESFKTERTEQEEEEVATNVGQEVNLLTLTFGWPEEEKKVGQDMNLLSLTFAQPEKRTEEEEEEDCPDVPDEVGALAAPLVQPPQPAAASPCSTDDEEAAYEDCDYMCRHPAAV